MEPQGNARLVAPGAKCWEGEGRGGEGEGKTDRQTEP